MAMLGLIRHHAVCSFSFGFLEVGALAFCHVEIGA
jgi:hypothetical protein